MIKAVFLCGVLAPPAMAQLSSGLPGVAQVEGWMSSLEAGGTELS